MILKLYQTMISEASYNRILSRRFYFTSLRSLYISNVLGGDVANNKVYGIGLTSLLFKSCDDWCSLLHFPIVLLFQYLMK